MSLLKQNLPKHQALNAKDNGVASTALDLLLLVLPYLSTEDGSALFDICVSSEVTQCADNAVQKRGYKILSKLIEHGKVTPDASAVLLELDKATEGLSPAAKKVTAVVYICHHCQVLKLMFRIDLCCSVC